jgi:ferredoxin-type protein NapG
MRTPTVNFNADYCDFCESGNGGQPRCVGICPTGALELPAGATPEQTIIGLAEIDQTSCLAYTGHTCRLCYDKCPYQAIELDADNRPVVKADVCNGCGACQAVCISLQSASVSGGTGQKAIVVVPPEEKGAQA